MKHVTFSLCTNCVLDYQATSKVGVKSSDCGDFEFVLSAIPSWKLNHVNY